MFLNLTLDSLVPLRNYKKKVLNERILLAICSCFRLSIWSMLGDTLARKAKIWVCLNKISQSKHHSVVHLPKNKDKQKCSGIHPKRHSNLQTNL